MSTHLTNPASHSESKTRVRPIRSPLPDDGTRPLLLGAFWTLLTGIFAGLATQFLFGGIGVHGPHTNAGWIALIVTMMCLPFGSMLLLLGGAKYLRNRRLARKLR
jgi:drug/metabolite transporter (DMT)-like permease